MSAQLRRRRDQSSQPGRRAAGVSPASAADAARAAEDHRRPGRGDRADLRGDLHARALPAGRRAGAGQDAHGQHAGADSRSAVQADSVHARPDALGHHGHERAGRRRRRAAVVPVRRRADLHEHSAGRRNQPHAAEDAGRAAAGDAGARSDGRPIDLPAAEPVLHDRHAEPDRAGRHVPAARSAARPLHVQHQGRLPVGRRKRSRFSRRPRGRTSRK